MTKENSVDAIERIKLENDLSRGNLIDSMPVKVQQTEIDLSVLDNLSNEHPRLLIQRRDLDDFRAKLKSDPSYCNFDTFLSNSTNKYLETTPYAEPKPYPPETVAKASLWRPYWRQLYIDCQMALNATRNLSIAGVILEDDAMIAQAKAWTLQLASYDPAGVTSGAYNDEAAFRVIAALAWGYDWLYSHFTADERATVKKAMIVRLEEVMHYLNVTIDLLANPLNSHGVRCISSVIVPTCIALYNEYPKARQYIEYSLTYYAEHYPPWGGEDGAWAEGPDYWNTQMAFLGEAFDLLKSYAGLNLFNKTFYENTGDFILYCMPVHSKRASFCDQSSIGDFPGLKLAYNIRHFAGVNNKPEYIWYYNQLKARDTDAHAKYYNYGWWDFGYDDLRFEYLWDDMPEIAPPNGPLLKLFPITGWAAFHNNMGERDRHVHMIYKCSPFGSISHSHGDQNAFTLHAFGDTLAAITGYYGGFGVDMHLKWRRQTISKNLPLFGGKGQYAENKASKFAGHQDRYCIEAGGHICDYDTTSDVPYVEGDATASYQFFNPDLRSYKRKIWFVKGKLFVMRDTATLDSEQDLTWLLHTTFQTETADKSFKIIGDNARLDVTFINSCSADIVSIENIEGFGDVDPAEYAGLDIHRHVAATFNAKKAHDILTLLIPTKAGAAKVDVSHQLIGDTLQLTVDDAQVTIHL